MNNKVIVNIAKSGIFFASWTVEENCIKYRNKKYVFDEMSDLNVAFNKVDFRGFDSLSFTYQNTAVILYAKTSMEEKLKLVEAYEYISQYVTCMPQGEMKMGRFYLSVCQTLLNNEKQYLGDLEKEIDYDVLKELYAMLPQVMQQYMTSVLRVPLQLLIPRSPQSAAFIGTLIGGVSVGMFAGLDAIEKRKAYNQNRIDIIKSQISQQGAADKLNFCMKQIEAILLNYDMTREDWNNKKKEAYIREFAK